MARQEISRISPDDLLRGLGEAPHLLAAPELMLRPRTNGANSGNTPVICAALGQASNGPVRPELDMAAAKAAIEQAYGGKATATSDASVLVSVSREAEWVGTVHIFSLTGHARTDTAYAWQNDGKVCSALMLESIGSPSDAVRAWLIGRR